MARVLVVLPTQTYRATDFVDAANGLGVEMAIASEEDLPLIPADRFVRIDCGDIEGSAQKIADLAAATPIDAIVAADDGGVEVAARAGELIGLPHNPPVAARATVDKIALRRMLAAAEVTQPSFRVLPPEADPTSAFHELGASVVIKPPMLAASQGVLRVDDPATLGPTVDRIRRIVGAAGRDPATPLLMETYVPGEEISVEGMVIDGGFEVLATFDKPDPLTGPAFQETMFVTPSRHDPSVLAEAHALVARGVRAIGLDTGPVHAEVRLSSSGPVLIEVASRTIGGLCGRSLRFGLLGASLETVVLRRALGMRTDHLRSTDQASGVLMVPIPRSGTLTSVSGVDEVRATRGVVDVDMTIPPGTIVAPPPDGDRYLGFVFATAEDPATVEGILRTAADTIVVDVTD